MGEIVRNGLRRYRMGSSYGNPSARSACLRVGPGGSERNRGSGGNLAPKRHWERLRGGCAMGPFRRAAYLPDFMVALRVPAALLSFHPEHGHPEHHPSMR